MTSYTGSLSPEYALLGLLERQPAHGYELHQRLANNLGQIWHISQSQTYNILNRLEDQGFIAGAMQAQEKLPARRQFHLTEQGRQRFEDWLGATSSCSVRAIRVEFITRLYFAQERNPQLARELITAQTADIQAGLARLKIQLNDLPIDQVFNRLGLELRIRQLSSIIDWLEDCRAAIQIRPK